MYKRVTKRIVDSILATVAFVISIPFFVFIMVLLAYVNRWRIFFLQSRSARPRDRAAAQPPGHAAPVLPVYGSAVASAGE